MDWIKNTIFVTTCSDKQMVHARNLLFDLLNFAINIALRITVSEKHYES